MEKSESRGGAKEKVLLIWAEAKAKAKAKAAEEGTEACFRAKGGGVIPAKRRLVKRMMWDRFASWVCFALGSCICSSAACSEPVGTKNAMAGVAQVLPLPPEH